MLMERYRRPHKVFSRSIRRYTLARQYSPLGDKCIRKILWSRLSLTVVAHRLQLDQNARQASPFRAGKDSADGEAVPAFAA